MVSLGVGLIKFPQLAICEQAVNQISRHEMVGFTVRFWGFGFFSLVSLLGWVFLGFRSLLVACSLAFRALVRSLAGFRVFGV